MTPLPCRCAKRQPDELNRKKCFSLHTFFLRNDFSNEGNAYLTVLKGLCGHRMDTEQNDEYLRLNHLHVVTTYLWIITCYYRFKSSVHEDFRKCLKEQVNMFDLKINLKLRLPDNSIGSFSIVFLTWSDSPVSELSSIFRSLPWIKTPSAGKRSPETHKAKRVLNLNLCFNQGFSKILWLTMKHPHVFVSSEVGGYVCNCLWHWPITLN